MNRRLKILAKVPFAPVVAAMFGAIAVILILMTPGWLFEQVVVASGLPTLIAAAQPPLGDTARKLSAIAGGLAIFSSLWAGLALLRALIKRNAPAKARGTRIDAASLTTDSPTIRRKREPIFAERELGAPFMSDEAIASVTEHAAPVEAEAPAPPIAEPLTPDTAPIAYETPLPVGRAAPHQHEAKNGLGDELARLQSALDRRRAYGLSARPPSSGNIASLRKALNGLR